MKKTCIALFLAVGMLLGLTACGQTGGASSSQPPAGSSSAAGSSAAISSAASSSASGSQSVSGSQSASGEAALDEAVAAAYRTALTDLLTNHTLDGEEMYYDEIEDMSENQFAVYDVDGDGREELVILYTTTCMARMLGAVYDYDTAASALHQELYAFPAITFYDNGMATEDWSHNQGLAGDFWPYTLYQYDSASDAYEPIASVDAWQKSLAATNSHGEAYPDDIDTSGTGFVYYIMSDGEYDESLTPVDDSAYQDWRDTQFGDATVLTVPFTPLTEDNIAQIGQAR